MKVKLLRKIRSRIVSVEFCGKCYVDVKYYDISSKLVRYRIYNKMQLLDVIRNMFGRHFAKHVESKDKSANLKRLKKMLNSPIKYSWKEDK